MATRLKLFNGAMPTTAAFVAVTTGTSIKTLLQLKAFNVAKIIAWGISFDGAAAAAGIQCELIETGTIFGTVTAHADADIYKTDGAEGAVASVQGLTLGTTATGYTCSSEGSIVSVKIFDDEFVQPTNGYIYQFPLGQEPKLIIGNAYRVRVKAAAAVNAITWVELEF
jgi:hypothetical protein